MIYVFKDNQLIREIPTKPNVWMLDHSDKKLYPTDCYIYDSNVQEWYVKRTRAYSRILSNKQVPSELKALCLIMRITL